MNSSLHDDPLRDDLGAPVPLRRTPQRVCSLVPSLSEALATSAGELLVAATDWCTHLGEAADRVTRVRGTKNPDLAAIRAVAPDVVIANQEENRELDVRRLREAGIPVWVTRIETLDEAFSSLQRIFTQLLDREAPAWLTESREIWAEPPRLDLRVVVPIWRDPWMVIGQPTFTADLLARAGAQVLPVGTGRYPHVEPEAIRRAAPDLVLLPDEPYPFTESDGPTELAPLPTACLPGRWVTWYGPSLVEARQVVERACTNPG